jgi:predicted peroxiredoxin
MAQNVLTSTMLQISTVISVNLRQPGRSRPVATPRPSVSLARAKVPGMSSRSLVVKVTAGKEDPERCNQAFTVAATAASSGVQVSLWLTGEASWFAVPGRCDDLELPHATPLPELLARILAAGSVTICTQCAARREIGEADLAEGIRIAGAATFVAEVLADGVQALVY